MTYGVWGHTSHACISPLSSNLIGVCKFQMPAQLPLSLPLPSIFISLFHQSSSCSANPQIFSSVWQHFMSRLFPSGTFSRLESVLQLLHQVLCMPVPFLVGFYALKKLYFSVHCLLLIHSAGFFGCVTLSQQSIRI